MTRYPKATFSVAAMLLSAGATRTAGSARRLPAAAAAPAGPQLLHPMFQDHARTAARPAAPDLWRDHAGRRGEGDAGRRPRRARAGADGRWSATLPAVTAGGPYSLTASANGETRTASDVLIGDVFFCAGQSNMAFSQRQAPARPMTHALPPTARSASSPSRPTRASRLGPRSPTACAGS